MKIISELYFICLVANFHNQTNLSGPNLLFKQMLTLFIWSHSVYMLIHFVFSFMSTELVNVFGICWIISPKSLLYVSNNSRWFGHFILSLNLFICCFFFRNLANQLISLVPFGISFSNLHWYSRHHCRAVPHQLIILHLPIHLLILILKLTNLSTTESGI